VVPVLIVHYGTVSAILHAIKIISMVSQLILHNVLHLYYIHGKRLSTLQKINQRKKMPFVFSSFVIYSGIDFLIRHFHANNAMPLSWKYKDFIQFIKVYHIIGHHV